MLFHKSYYLESLLYQEKKEKKEFLKKPKIAFFFSYLIFNSISEIVKSSPSGVFILHIEHRPLKPGMIFFPVILKKLIYLESSTVLTLAVLISK